MKQDTSLWLDISTLFFIPIIRVSGLNANILWEGSLTFPWSYHPHYPLFIYYPLSIYLLCKKYVQRQSLRWNAALHYISITVGRIRGRAFEKLLVLIGHTEVKLSRRKAEWNPITKASKEEEAPKVLSCRNNSRIIVRSGQWETNYAENFIEIRH